MTTGEAVLVVINVLKVEASAETQRILLSLSRRRDVKLWLARTVNPWLFAVTSAPTISILSGTMRPGAEITLPHTDADPGFLIRPHRQTNCPSILPFFLPLTRLRPEGRNTIRLIVRAAIRTEPRSAGRLKRWSHMTNGERGFIGTLYVLIFNNSWTQVEGLESESGLEDLYRSAPVGWVTAGREKQTASLWKRDPIRIMRR